MKTTQIKSIRRVGVRQTFDLKVAQDESYIANGLIVHNSSSNPNLTQIPSAKDIYGIKECFTA